MHNVLICAEIDHIIRITLFTPVVYTGLYHLLDFKMTVSFCRSLKLFDVSKVWKYIPDINKHEGRENSEHNMNASCFKPLPIKWCVLVQVSCWILLTIFVIFWHCCALQYFIVDVNKRKGYQKFLLITIWLTAC